MSKKFYMRATVLSILTALFLWQMFAAWHTETQQTVTCTTPPKIPFRYYEIALREQNPTYPEYESEVFVYYSDPSEMEAAGKKITIKRSGARTYASETAIAEIAYNSNNRALEMRNWAKLGLIPVKGGLHQNFPFDSAQFDFEINTDPWFEPSTLRITNRIPGFYLPCSSIKMAMGDKRVRILFNLKRSPLIALVTVVLCLVAPIFALLILQLTKIETVASSTASFFFSVWSIRTILNTQLHTFPTLFDCWLMTLCVLLLVALLWKIELHRIKFE